MNNDNRVDVKVFLDAASNDEIDESECGGESELDNYIRDNTEVIENRTAPHQPARGVLAEGDANYTLGSNGSSGNVVGFTTMPDEDLPVASIVEDQTAETDSQVIDGVLLNQQQRPQKKLIIMRVMLLISALLILIVPLSIQLRPGSNSRNDLGSLSLNTTRGGNVIYSEILKKELIPLSGEDKLDDRTSPQHDAWARISVYEDFYLKNPEELRRILQAYVIAVISFSFSSFFEPAKVDSSGYILGMECFYYACTRKGELTMFAIRHQEASVYGGGTLANEIGYLSKLRVILLDNNSFVGTIPTEIGLLQELSTIDLSHNELSQTIPTELGQTKINYLYLNDNELLGTIPSEIGNVSSLKYADFSENMLQGTVPLDLINLDELEGLDMHQNELHGNIDFLCNKTYQNERFDFSSMPMSYFGGNYRHVGFSGILIDCDEDNDNTMCTCCVCVPT